MCPTGWFIETQDAPDYLDRHLAATHTIGVLKDVAANSAATSTVGPSELSG